MNTSLAEAWTSPIGDPMRWRSLKTCHAQPNQSTPTRRLKCFKSPSHVKLHPPKHWCNCQMDLSCAQSAGTSKTWKTKPFLRLQTTLFRWFKPMLVILQEDLVRRERKSKPDVIVEMIILYVALVILSRNASCACAVLYPHRCLHLLLTKVNTIDLPVYTGLHIKRNSRMVWICLQMWMSQIGRASCRERV